MDHWCCGKWMNLKSDENMVNIWWKCWFTEQNNMVIFLFWWRSRRFFLFSPWDGNLGIPFGTRDVDGSWSTPLGSNHFWFVVQFHHLEKWWTSSMGLGWHPFFMKWKIKFMFETTNQIWWQVHWFSNQRWRSWLILGTQNNSPGTKSWEISEHLGQIWLPDFVGNRDWKQICFLGEPYHDLQCM